MYEDCQNLRRFEEKQKQSQPVTEVHIWNINMEYAVKKDEDPSV